MCQQGDYDLVEVREDVKISRKSYRTYLKKVQVDSCISDIVRALNTSGIRTVGCCCGHGLGYGYIMLEDGTQMTLMSREDHSDLMREKIVEWWNLEKESTDDP